MGGKIGREHKGCDQREIGLRRPIEENPADNGGVRWISLLHTSNARVRSNNRHARNILITRRRFAYNSGNHIALVAATTPLVFSRAPRRNFDELVDSRTALDIRSHNAGCRMLPAGSRAGAAPWLLYTSCRRHRSCGCRRTWHGGRAGKGGGTNRRRCTEARRQRGRCGGGKRPCNSPVLSARPEYRAAGVYRV